MIELKNVKKSFGDRVLFKAGHLVIPEHALFGIYGPSGTGKTTFLNMISLLDFAYEGELLIDGRSYRRLRATEKKRETLFSYVFSEPFLIEYLTARENILYACSLAHTAFDESLMAMIRKNHMDHLLDQKVMLLSEGERQRISLFRALAMKRDYLILDEPTAHLDEENSKQMMKIVADVKNDYAGIIFSSHDSNLKQYCSERAEIKNHEIIVD